MANDLPLFDGIDHDDVMPAFDRRKPLVIRAVHRLALRCLLPHCRERWPLEMFWDAAATDNEIGRAQGCTAGFNGIVRQLRLAGRYT
jgi:hypothetical protein